MSSPSRRGQPPSPHDGLPHAFGGSPLEVLGRSLRRAREANGLEAKDLSARLRIGVEQLIALENGDRSRLPEAVFVLAQARRIAAALGADIDQELIALRSSGQLERQAKSPETEAGPPAERDPGNTAASLAAGQEPPPGLRLRPLALLFTAALLLGGGGVALWRLQPFSATLSLPDLGDFVPRPAAQPSAPPPPVTPPSDNASSASVPGPAPVSPAAAPATGAGRPSLPPLAMPAAKLPAAAGNSPRPAPTPAFKPAAPTNLVISAKGPSWLEVRDSKGQVLYRGLFAEERSFPLGNGLQVLAGRPDLVSTRLGAGPSRLLGTISEVRWQSFASRP